MSNNELLKELRLARDIRDPAAPGGVGGAIRWRWLAGVAGVAVAAAAIALSSSGDDAPVPPPQEATVAVAEPSTPTAVAPETGTAAHGTRADVLLQATGYVTARRKATVSSQITGLLVDLRVEEGDRVDAGQVLARLEGRSFSASERAAAAAALAAEAQVSQARVELEQARRAVERHDELLRSQLVSRETAEQARSDLEAAQAQLRVAQRQADAARAQADLAEVATTYTTIRAPFAGVVIQKAAQVGEIVSPQSTGGFTRSGICTIVDMDSLEVDVDVNEAYIGRVKAGMPGEIVLDAYPEWRIPAHVIAIVPTADRGKATVRVRVGFEAKDARIVPDMGARVSFLRAQDDDGQVAETRPPAAGAGAG